MKLVKNIRFNFMIVLFAFSLLLLIPLLLTIITKNYRYSSLSVKVVGVVVLAGSLLYTYNVFEKQIKNNVLFGITRKETHKKWALKITFVGLYVILINIINNVLSCILIPGTYNNFYEFLGMTATALGGFYLYFFLNYILFFEIANTIDRKRRKNKALIIMIGGFLVSVFFSFLLYIFSAISRNLEFGIFIVFIIDIVVGPLILIVGLMLLSVDKKNITKGVY